jgi:hypothetical protein
MAGVFKRRLFGSLTEEQGNAMVDDMVRKAVEMFLCYYGAKRSD